jgi:predicted unusual protein kinase regulating ubiquinone biosynthesis (AarF/ABC1/UbiB family)
VRLLRIYATIARVLSSYLWLRLWRPLLSPETYAARLEQRHRTNARRIYRAIIRAGGLFIKVGQLISILSNVLPSAFREQLEGLQDRLPARPFDEIAGLIRAELGAGPDEAFRQFEREPIATASLAQVHAATLDDGRRVAVKVQHRDIDHLARQDLVVVRRIFRLVQWFTGLRGLENYHPEISRMIAEELDFVREAANIERVAANFAGQSDVRCPTVVHEKSTARILTTEFIAGTKVTDFPALAARGVNRRELASRVVSAYCRMIFVDSVYHADPHPGNILVAEDGAIAFVDFGAVGVLAPHMRQGIPMFFEGVLRRDPQRITEAIHVMGFVSRDPNRSDIAQRVIDYFQRRVLDDMSAGSFALGDMKMDFQTRLETLADLRKLDVSLSQLTTTFQVPTDWVLLERTLLLLLGLCTELDPSWNPMAVIGPYLEDVVLGDDRDWGELLRGSVKEMARRAVTLPEDMQQALNRVNRGDVQVRVPEIADAARMLYAGVRQLIYCVLATATGVVAYQAYDRGRETLGRWLAAGALLAIVALVVSMNRTARRG